MFFVIGRNKIATETNILISAENETAFVSFDPKTKMNALFLICNKQIVDFF